MTRRPYEKPKGITRGRRRARFVGSACGLAVAVFSASVAWSQTDPNGPSAPVLNGELARRLWETRISLPDSDVDTEAKDDLQNLIQRVRSLQFQNNEVTPSFTSPGQATPAAEPNQVPVQRTGTGATPTTPPSPQATPAGPLQAATLDHLNQAAQAPEKVSNPLEVAELLFISGYTVEAVPFYESALARTSQTNETTRSDRAWILFQLANCLRETDMTRARDTYQKLVAEHPDSPWTELARAQGRIITWYLTEKPEQLLTEP